MADATRARGGWPFHPKYAGLAVAAGGFALALATAPLEAQADPAQALFISAVRTLLAFLGGSGFTAWLSMSIYEYVQARGQERAWRREFALDMVRSLYGPLYDEVQTAVDRLPQMTTLRVPALSALRMRHLSLLVPAALLKKGAAFRELIAEHDRLVELERGQTQARVADFAAEYMGKRGVPPESRPGPTGAESRHILGGPILKDYYDRFLKEIGDSLRKHSLDWDAVAFDRELREAVSSAPEAKANLARRKRIEEGAREILRELEPLIRRPYE